MAKMIGEFTPIEVGALIEASVSPYTGKALTDPPAWRGGMADPQHPVGPRREAFGPSTADYGADAPWCSFTARTTTLG